MNTYMKTEKDLNGETMNGETMVDKAQDAAAQVQSKVSETAGVAKDQVKRAAVQVGDQAKTTVDSRMNDVAQDLGSVADAVRQTSNEVEGENSETIARYGERIADQIDGVSSYLNEHGVEEILTDIEGFARRQPALFLGGAFMLGIAVGRFLRSSNRVDIGENRTGYDQYGTGYSGMGTGIGTGNTSYDSFESRNRSQYTPSTTRTPGSQG